MFEIFAAIMSILVVICLMFFADFLPWISFLMIVIITLVIIWKLLEE